MAGHAARLLIYSARARLRCVLGQPEAYKARCERALGRVGRWHFNMPWVRMS